MDSYPNGCTEGSSLKNGKEVDWIYGADADFDLRLMFAECRGGRFVPSIQWKECQFDLISPVTQRPYCYSTEASNYAQSTFLYAIVFSQYANYQSLRSLKS